MYLYFDRRGILKEVINDEALRQGNVNVNKIYVYVEELDTSIPQNFFVNYRLPDGTKIPEFQQSFLAIPTSNYMEVPYNPRRDLKFFKYYQKYPFYEIDTDVEIEGTQYNALSQYGSVALTLRVGSLNTLGLVIFDVEESVDASPEIHWDEYISLAQFNYLLSLLSQYYTKEQVESYVLTVMASYAYSKEQIDTLLNSYYTKTETDNALSGKVDKLTTSGQYVYSHLGSTQSEIPVSTPATGSTIAKRENDGRLKVATPTSENDATTKSYVDSELSSGLSTKQNTLVSGTNIKSLTVDGVEKSLLGSGTIEVGTGGGGGAWGEITGDIQDQTDLQAEFQDIREVAEGKCKTYVLSYLATAPTTDAQARALHKVDGTNFASLSEFNTYFTSYDLNNSAFNTQNDDILMGYQTSSPDPSTNYYIFIDGLAIKDKELKDIVKTGDFIIVKEAQDNSNVNLPDRWLYIEKLTQGRYSLYAYKLETSKIDLTNYATKTEVAQKSDLSNIAPLYDSDTTYAVGDKTIHDGNLYTCTTAITTPESWDSTHWTQISVASGFVDLDKEQVISGVKRFTGGTITDSARVLYLRSTGDTAPIYSRSDFVDLNNGTHSLGSSSYKWKDLYLSGVAYTGTVRNNATISLDTIGTGGKVRPSVDGTDLGDSTHTWGNLYLSGNIILGSDSNITASNLVINGNGIRPLYSNVSNLGLQNRRWQAVFVGNELDFTSSSTKILNHATNTTYGLTLPDTTNFTANKEIATTDQAFNVINASDISVSGTTYTFTEDQLAIISNGKPTLIIGAAFGFKGNVLLFPANDPQYSSYDGLAYGQTGTYSSFNLRTYSINKTTGVVTIYNEADFGIAFSRSAGGKTYFNGKKIPDYPSSTGTFGLQMVNGTMAWNEQWYGTQAEYDALTSYDSNTTYNILES